MANVIHVTPAQLTSAAGQFQTTAGQIKSLTSTMTSTVEQLSGRVWSGEAATAYKNKFNGLQNDINKLYQMVTKHSNHLRDIATEYQNRENENKQAASSLGNSFIG